MSDAIMYNTDIREFIRQHEILRAISSIDTVYTRMIRRYQINTTFEFYRFYILWVNRFKS